MSHLSNRCGVLVNDSLRILVSDEDYTAVVLYNGYPDNLLMFAYTCSMICMIIGIPGNFITIIALANYEKVRNATAIFIINISIADLLLLCMDPPLAISNMKNRSWTHGRVLCQQYPAAKFALIAASIFTTMAITINRYILIIYPRLYRKIYRTRHMLIMLTAIWISPLLILMPTYLGKWGCFDLDVEDGTCSVVADQYKRSSKKFLFISALGLPCIPIIYCYIRIFLKVRKVTKKALNKPPLQTLSSSTEDTTTHNSFSVITKFPAVISASNSEEEKENIPMEPIGNWKSENNSKALNYRLGQHDSTKYNTTEDIPESLKLSGIKKNILKRSTKFLKFALPTRKDKRLGTMILAIMTSFCLGHLPTVITEMIRGITPHPQLQIAAQILLYFSSCFNPVIYVVMSKEYQKAYKNLFKCHGL